MRLVRARIRGDVRILTLCTILMAMFLVGCEGGTGPEGPLGPNGPQGPQGPQGPDGGPGPVSLLVLGSDSARLDEVALAVFGAAALPSGSDVATWQLAPSAGGTVPTLGDLAAYDVVLVYTNALPGSNAAPAGDVLADYADAGGKVLLTQASYTSGYEIMGRIMTDGYSPWSAGADAGDATDRTIDVSSVALPPHPVFTGINLPAWSATQIAASSMSAPATLGTPTTLATFTNGHNAVAINQAGNVMAINLFVYSYESEG
ncbi:hypothetical protein K8I85_06595, partial [bacterium]|nr:hypothetical protein [bacterium]